VSRCDDISTWGEEMRRGLLLLLGGATVALVLSHGAPAAAAPAPSINTSTSNVVLSCRFGPDFNFVFDMSLTTSVPASAAPGAPIAFAATPANFFENPVPYNGFIQFEAHFRVRSATPGNVTLKSPTQRFATGDLDLLGGAVLTKQFTAGSVGPSVEFEFTEFRYTITPDVFQKFTVTCKPSAPVSVALIALTDAPGTASVVAKGKLGACHSSNKGLRSCTQFDIRPSRTSRGVLRGPVRIECNRASVIKFSSQHVTRLDVANGVATIEATGRLGDRSDATASIVATDGPTFDKLSVKLRVGTRVVCSANGRLDAGAVVVKT
jgi:hypothetical protein